MAVGHAEQGEDQPSASFACRPPAPWTRAPHGHPAPPGTSPGRSPRVAARKRGQHCNFCAVAVRTLIPVACRISSSTFLLSRSFLSSSTYCRTQIGCRKVSSTPDLLHGEAPERHGEQVVVV